MCHLLVELNWHLASFITSLSFICQNSSYIYLKYFGNSADCFRLRINWPSTSIRRFDALALEAFRPSNFVLSWASTPCKQSGFSLMSMLTYFDTPSTLQANTVLTPFSSRMLDIASKLYHSWSVLARGVFFVSFLRKIVQEMI